MQYDTKPATILVVDDTPLNLSLLFEMLQQHGYKVHIAQNGERAFTVLKDHIPDLILLDISMPDMDGYEVCKILKKDEGLSTIPIIFLTALNEPEDKIKGFQAGGVDYITKPIQNEEVLARVSTHIKLRKQQKELEEVNANKNRFFGLVAHDIKSPLRGIVQLTKFYEDFIPYLPEDKKQEFIEYNQLLNNATQNLQHFLENLLRWAKIQMDRLEFEPKSINMHALVKQSIELLVENASKKKIQIHNTLNPSCTIYADTTMVLLILQNLMSNAIKFTPTHGNVYISGKSEEKQHTFEIRDTGIGLKPSELNRLFKIEEHYFNKGTDGEEGSGLGLILVKEFISKHQGTIWMESQPNQGTSVFFTIPHKDT